MKVSVVLPAYNAELYLKESIDSILAQTFTDFELIVLNDGSIDRTEEIILSYQDARIVYVKNERNLGLIGTLNKGLALAKGEYIARMDADDISLPERFSRQVDFLEKNQEYVICGTSAYRFYKDVSDGRAFNVPLDNESIRIRLLFNSSFIHPSVMFRTDTIRNYNLNYSEDYKYAEDYFFWINILKCGKGFNFKEKLLYYRIVNTSQTAVGNSNMEERKEILGNIHDYCFSNSGIFLDTKEVEAVFYLSNLDRMKMLDLERFDFYFLSVFFEKIISLLRKNGFSNKDIYINVGRFYFSLIYIKYNELVKKKLFWEIVNKILFSYGFISIFKERILR